MRRNLQVALRHTRLITLAAIMLMLVSGTALMQSKKPYSKEILIKALRLNALSTAELIQKIQERGVEFTVGPQDEADLQAAGARPELIEAVRANYRPANTPSPVASTRNSRTPANVPAGPPLSKNEVITLLQSGVGSARVEQFVEVRGVSFSVTPAIAREITAAGGNRSLIGAITERAVAESNGGSNGRVNAFGPNSPANRGPSYDDLTDRATDALRANNAYGAIGLLQQAIRLDPSQPSAYALLGFAQLYGNRNIAAAQEAMRAAIEHGGGAVFRVYHNHTGVFETYCEGSLFVRKGSVSYKADDGRDTFDTTDANIKEIKTNALIGANYGAFHIKVKQEVNGRSNYDFAPATKQKAESNLIISLVKSYQQ